MMMLKISDRLNQYINAHYNYLIYLSMGLSALLAIVQLVRWVKMGESKIKEEKVEPFHELSKGVRIRSLFLLSLPLVVGFTFPKTSLDSTIVQSKGFHFPKSGETTNGADARVQYLKPDTSIYFNQNDYGKIMEKLRRSHENKKELTITAKNYLEMMELIYYAPNEFLGKKIIYSGFVYRDSSAQMGKNMAFIFRFGVVHCIADSGVFGLLNEFPKNVFFENNEWVKVAGVLETKYVSLFKQTLPFLKVESVSKKRAPSNQYVYRKF
jgi:putative membrane protein